MIKMNINSQCRVKLTEYGKQVIDQANKENKLYPKVISYQCDDDGYLTTELWDVMYLFGSHMYRQPIETDIEVKPL